MSGEIENFDVGPSRDGDQFHYARASRICLELLRPTSDLKVVSVEGVSKGDGLNAGIESIDLALYYGSADLTKARQVRYRQLKHSTVQAEKEWTASGLRKSLKDFADRFSALVGRFGVEDVGSRFVFEFETNRPLSPLVDQALADLRRGKRGRVADYIARVTELETADLSLFASLFQPITRVEGFLEQRARLDTDLRAYLPDNDKDAAIALRDYIARKATSEFKSNHEIRREDVLHVMGTRWGDLFPAPNELELPAAVVPRAQMPDLAQLITASTTPILITADGGFGKSIVVTQIEHSLPGSTAFVYDCFGNGAYRSATGLRHRAKDGLVQLANEMAATSLCDPLIPTPKADDSAYVRAFLGRLSQASSTVQARSAEALLVLIVDAADNAEMAAEEFHDQPSFPRLLLSEVFPENVRLVLTARPHRVGKLQPPPGVVYFPLDGFNEEETGDLLRTRFPDVQDADVREFHRLTSRNPRVQRTALDLDPTASLSKVLRSLGPLARTVGDTIGALLESAVSRTRHGAAAVERPQIDRICTALATLRPFVPIKVIAATAGVDEGLVRSFIHDLGRPLLLRDDAVQFRDEPTETWFQDHFKPGAEELESFLRRLQPLARESRYAASALPGLMLSAGRLDELVQLALHDDALPQDDEIARRDVELQRLQFAARAALRTRRYADAARLALKAGGLAAADDRQQTLLSGNVDLASLFLDADQILEQVSRRQIVGGNWTGSEHAYEASLLSGHPGLTGEARSQLRLAYEWLNHFLRNRDYEDHRQSLADEDILELLWAELNLHGPKRCAVQLRRWTPREISYRVGQPLAKRLVDASRWADADALALAAGNDIGLVLAIAVELDSVGRYLPKAAAARALKLLMDRRIELKASGGWQGETKRISSLVTMVFGARHHRLASKRAMIALLRRYLPKVPPRTIESDHLNEDRFAYLRAYALLAELSGKIPTLDYLYGAKRGKHGRKGVNETRPSDRELGNLRVLLPWHELAVKVQLGTISMVGFESSSATALDYWKSHQRDSYQGWSTTADELTKLWSDCIARLGGEAALWACLAQWQSALRVPLFIPTYADLARRIALTGGPTEFVHSFANQGRARIGEDSEPAESMADSYIILARAVLGASTDEASLHFNEAVRVASKIGQENLERWHGLLHLADACPQDATDDPYLAYRFARAAELTYSFVDRDKHFDWGHTVEAIAGLSPDSAFAIVSRWRDRRFGEPERLLPQLVGVMCKRGHLDARDTAALVCFQGDWDWPTLIEAAVDSAEDISEKEALLAHFYRYLSFATGYRAHLKDVAENIQARGLDSQPFRELEQRAQRSVYPSAPYGTSTVAKRENTPDWSVVFDGIDLGTPAGLRASRARLPDSRFGWWRDAWTAESLSRVPAGKERAFLESLETIDDLSLHSVNDLLKCIPAAWAERLAARQALASLVRQVVRDNAASMGINRYYQPLSFDLVLEKTGITRSEILKRALEVIAETGVSETSNGLFQLVTILAEFLEPVEARSALGYGLDLLERTLGSDQGDDPRGSRLAPLSGPRKGVAGYIWAALGAVESGRRWQAAHTIRALCWLGREALLADVVALANGGDASAFTDAGFHFYRMHATQWLLIAFDRASRESGEFVARYAEWIESFASRQTQHVIWRAIAARTLLTLADRGHLVIAPSARDALTRINVSNCPPLLSTQRTQRHQGPFKSDKTGEFSFGYDFLKSWIGPLARCFAVPSQEIESIACRVIRGKWGLRENGHYDRDARALRGYFKESRRRRGGELGGQDDLSFYLSYHALMEAAGQLLETHPVHEDPESSWSSFSYWLEYTAGLGSSGDWVADSRQMPPLDTLEFPKHKRDEWPVPATKAHLLSRLSPQAGTVVIAGRWTQYEERNSQTISVKSALAGRSRAGALARALATTRNPYDYSLPDFGDDDEIHHEEFVLEGWVIESDTESGADSNDPWAGGLAHRFWNLAPPIAERLGLVLAENGSTWCRQDGACMAWLERWSESPDEESERVPNGHRLVVDQRLLQSLLAQLDQTLIVEVRCHRQVVPFSYESRSENGEEHATSIFTIGPSGRPIAVSGNARPRRKARRRAKTR